MGQPYVGEIRMFGGTFAPAGWMTCDGQLLPISDYDTLFNLIGTTYGGNGQTTFGLPNLAARVPIHQGSNGTNNYNLAQNGGATSVTLTMQQLPVHTHPAVGDNNTATTNTGVPTNALYGNTSPNKIFAAGAIPGHLHTMMTLPAQGGSQPHDNMQPYLAITFIISIFGIYPSPT